ncbi:MAG: SMP-30/gluconolactonase/LRE family protein [Bacteroidetes bacterium]|nr:SMP-30/gluconolactonase/LRE family protein [Bacteroidota bacterium]
MQKNNQSLFEVSHYTEPGTFTSGAEGPSVDTNGNLFAVNYNRQGTIGKVTPNGESTVFLELSDGSIANGIRFNSKGEMFLADYVNHNVLKVDTDSRKVSVFAHEPGMNQPNDLAIGANDILYASDPNWSESTGQLWRIDTEGTTTLLEENMGTTNGLEVSADETKLYVGESVQRKIWQYDLSNDGEISNKQLLIEFSDFGLDGMRCDHKGNLYITRHGKGTVLIVSPVGEIIREIEMLEGKSITNLAFGGPDGKTVYCTVADIGNIQSFRTDTPGRSWNLFD